MCDLAGMMFLQTATSLRSQTLQKRAAEEAQRKASERADALALNAPGVKEEKAKVYTGQERKKGRGSLRLAY